MWALVLAALLTVSQCRALPPIGTHRARMLDADSCARLHHKLYDPTMVEDVPAKQALILKQVRVTSVPLSGQEEVSLSIPSSCLAQLSPQPDSKGIRVSMHTYPWISYNAAQAKEHTCVKAPGTWFLLSDRGHGQDNVFEDLNAVWYPIFLTARLAGNLSAAELRMTFLGGHRKNFFAFDEVYRILGHHVPWTMIVQRGGVTGGGAGGVTGNANPPSIRCTEFERVLIAGAEYNWLNAPVLARRNVALTRFVSAIVGSMGLGHVHPPRCKPSLFYATRNRPYRSLINEAEMLEGVAAALPGYTLRAEELAGRPLFEQLTMVRSASIFMFSHGGAGPLVMFLFPGAVIVELFPYNFADPMYRNMAVMTGKIYLAWQNRNEDKAFELQRLKRNSNTLVDVPQLMGVLHMAATLNQHNLLDSFLSVNGTPYMRGLCDWCSPDQLNYQCDPEVELVPRYKHQGEQSAGLQ